MSLTKEQWIELSNIFHDKYDSWSYPLAEQPSATFPAVVDIVEEFMDKVLKYENG